MRLIQDENGVAAAFVFLRGEQICGLRDEHRLLIPGGPSEREDDPGVEATGSDGGVAQVDDGGAAGIQASQEGADRDGLAGPDLTGDDAEGLLGQAPADPGDRFTVRVVPVQHLRRQGLAERGAGEAIVRLQVLDH